MTRSFINEYQEKCAKFPYFDRVNSEKLQVLKVELSWKGGQELDLRNWETEWLIYITPGNYSAETPDVLAT